MLIDIEADPFPYKMGFHTVQASMAKRYVTSKGRETLFKAIEMLSEAEENKNLKETVKEIKKDLRERRELHFWDEKDQN